jgi:hypothetical protein
VLKVGEGYGILPFDPEHFEIYYPRLYANQNFATYAAKIANQLSSDLQEDGRQVKVKTGKADFLSDLIAAIKKWNPRKKTIVQQV